MWQRAEYLWLPAASAVHVKVAYHATAPRWYGIDDGVSGCRVGRPGLPYDDVGEAGGAERLSNAVRDLLRVVCRREHPPPGLLRQAFLADRLWAAEPHLVDCRTDGLGRRPRLSPLIGGELAAKPLVVHYPLAVGGVVLTGGAEPSAVGDRGGRTGLSRGG